MVKEAAAALMYIMAEYPDVTTFSVSDDFLIAIIICWPITSTRIAPCIATSDV